MLSLIHSFTRSLTPFDQRNQVTVSLPESITDPACDLLCLREHDFIRGGGQCVCHAGLCRHYVRLDSGTKKTAIRGNEPGLTRSSSFLSLSLSLSLTRSYLLHAADDRHPLPPAMNDGIGQSNYRKEIGSGGGRRTHVHGMGHCMDQASPEIPAGGSTRTAPHRHLTLLSSSSLSLIKFPSPDS